MNDFQIHQRANGDFDVELLPPQRREERGQKGARRVSGVRGAEKADGHSAARSGGASDLPVEIEDDGLITVYPELRP